jgi:outer membrane receptor protein involved in Fe transport
VILRPDEGNVAESTASVLLLPGHVKVRSRNYLISVTAIAALWGRAARADDLPPDLAGVTEGEAIEVFDERPDKPFDRDTALRLTGEQLAARGAVDLATALALLPDVTVRDAGRGGFNIDIRGARKGAVAVLIDGVLVSDPYYGTFDVSTIPITDIVQIRVATTPQSPIDGPGGPGGVIEVHTRDAIGPQVVIGRLTADSLPSFGMTGTARVALIPHLALRLSASGLGGARDLDLPGQDTISERRYATTGAGRLEYRKGDRRIAADGFIDNRHYVSPPSDTMRSSILLIDRETSARASIKADDRFGSLQLQAQAWTHYLMRRSRSFADPALTSQQQVEHLSSLRSGAMALATRPFWREFRWAASTTVDFEKAVVSNIANDVVRGKTMVLEMAGDVQYEHRALRADLAAGLAVPFGVPADPWPEGKAVVKYRARPDLELTATGAYKGRVPSLRERFDSDNGNAGLGTERIAHAELRAIEQLGDRVRIELAPYFKRSTGTIVASRDPMAMGRLINLSVVRFWGVDTQARVAPHPLVDVGAGYQYVKAHSSDTGDDPLDRLPHSRWDAWAQVRPERRISVLARAKYFGSAIDQTRRVDGYTLIEACITAQITPQYLGVLRIDDLADARPETRAGYHTAGRVVSLIMQGTWE